MKMLALQLLFIHLSKSWHGKRKLSWSDICIKSDIKSRPARSSEHCLDICVFFLILWYASNIFERQPYAVHIPKHPAHMTLFGCLDMCSSLFFPSQKLDNHQQFFLSKGSKIMPYNYRCTHVHTSDNVDVYFSQMLELKHAIYLYLRVTFVCPAASNDWNKLPRFSRQHVLISVMCVTMDLACTRYFWRSRRFP